MAPPYLTKKYAEVAVNRHINDIEKLYSYHIPLEWRNRLQVGHLVEVDFGTATLNGIIVDEADSVEVPETKPIRRLLDPVPVVTQWQIELAQQIARMTLTPIGPCLWLMLPPGLTAESQLRYTLVDHDYPVRSDTQKRIFSLLSSRGALTEGQLDRAIPRSNWRGSIKRLVDNGAIISEKILRRPTAKPKKIRTVSLAIPPAAVEGVAMTLGRESRRANILEVLLAAHDHHLPMKKLLSFTGLTEKPVKTLVDTGAVDIDSDDVELLLTPDEAQDMIIDLRGGQKYLAILQLLADAGEPLTVGEIYHETATSLFHLRRLAEDDLVVLGEEEIWRDPLEALVITPDLAPPLTESQQEAWAVVRQYLDGVRWGEGSPDPDTSHVFLLHGVTGSGKTEIYMRAVERVLAQGRQAIVLVPEIALTAQLVRRFSSRFPRQVSVIHSQLSVGERYDTWRRARSGEIKVIIGPRSALFVPLPDPGLIVLDEEHDDSYKQSPPVMPPYYHAREVAIAAMHINRGTVILGSATPAITSMYRAQVGDYVLLSLPNRVLAHRDKIKRQIEFLNLPAARYLPTDVQDAVSIDLPPVEVVDMCQELRVGNRSVFSRALHTTLRDVLNARQQAILFLNRRGYATFVMCRDCGHVVECPHCDMPLTYHRSYEHLMCHYCGRTASNPTECPACGSERIKHFGTGTQLVDRALKDMFPGLRVLRWDQDTARQRGAHERILMQFMKREADVLVGTQMIAKGLDIPLVTLVGIISGDTALGLPDFRVGERTFQLLTQVAGRAGRGLLGGQVILQTYQPDNYAIAAAAEHDYFRFYEQELEYRQMLLYPPFSRLARVLIRHHKQPQAMAEAEKIAQTLRMRLSDFTATEVIGPTACFFMRLDKVFRWQVLVRSPNPTLILQNLDLGPDASLEIDPVDLL